MQPNAMSVSLLADNRPNKVFRACDHIYEQFFGYDAFQIVGEGCRRFSTEVNSVQETGVYCACEEDRCNAGIINDVDVIDDVQAHSP